MKRYIFLVAAVALATVSCSKTYDTAPASSRAIGFGTWAETLTRTISDPRTAGTNTFGVGDSFAVYGYKSDAEDNGKSTVFDAGSGKDVEVEMTTAGTPGTWTYSPLRYWDVNYAKYTFFAVSPSSVGKAATVTPQTGAITSASITFAGNDNDILVADKETVLKSTDNYASQVVLDFNHVASLVDFKVAKAKNLHDATVTVSAFSLSNIENVGVMNVSSAYNANVYGGTNGPVVTWGSGTTGTYGPESGVIKVKVDAGGNYEADGTNTINSTHPILIAEDDAFPVPAEPGSGKSTFLINNLVVKPQTFAEPTAAERETPATAATAQKLTITYKIAVTDGDTNEYTSTLFLYDFDIVNNEAQTDTKVASWDTGKHYTFYITLDSKPIVFGARINDWTVGTGYHYLVN